ncbi:MAG: group 1 truncated hemoglobin [Burkholderiales bacterium]|nr:group 1 truncated hemoglobin [Burkholderiales bacterium]
MTKLLVAALVATCALNAAQAQPNAPANATIPAPADDVLFRDLGGQAGIDRIVRDFVPRLAADARLGEFFKRANQDHLEQMLGELFCRLSGGGCTYTGLSMKLAHQDIEVGKGDFNALVEVLQSAMEAQGVPFATQNRLLARLAPLHRDIVNVH